MEITLEITPKRAPTPVLIEFFRKKNKTENFWKKNSWKNWKFRFFWSTRKIFSRIFRFFKIENLKNLKFSKISFKILKELARFPLRSLRNWPKFLKNVWKTISTLKNQNFSKSPKYFPLYFSVWSRFCGLEMLETKSSGGLQGGLNFLWNSPNRWSRHYEPRGAAHVKRI